MKEKISSTSWSFKTEQVYPWAFWKNAFSKEECEKIIKLGKSYNLHKAEVVKNKKEHVIKKNIRETNVVFMVPRDDTFFIFEKLTSIITELNNKYFGFDLYGLNEGLQFTNYVAPHGKYDKHVDKLSPGGILRKLSFSLQLSNPKNYTGGNLNLYFSKEKTTIDKEQGYLVLFPSYTMHEVTKVTKGERNSLVGWIAGPPFK